MNRNADRTEAGQGPSKAIWGLIMWFVQKLMGHMLSVEDTGELECLSW